MTPPASPVLGVRLVAEQPTWAGAPTWTAEDDQNQRLVVRWPPLPAHRRDLRERFRREARALVSLRHPGLIPCLHAVLTAAGDPVVMHLQDDAPTLAAVIAERGPLPWRDAVQLVRDVAAALASAHHEGLVHRAITPEVVHLHPRPTDGMGAFHPTLAGLGAVLPEVAAQVIDEAAPELTQHADTVDFLADIHGLGTLLACAAGPQAPQPVLDFVAHLRHPDRHQRPASDVAVLAACDRLLGRLRLGRHGNRSAWGGMAAAVLACGVGAAVAAASMAQRHDLAPAPLAAFAPATPHAAEPAPVAVDDGLERLAWDESERLWDRDDATRLDHWTLDPASQWMAAEQRPDAVAGFRGWVHRTIGPPPWRIEARLHLVPDTDGGTEGLYLGITLEDGGRAAVRVAAHGATAVGHIVRQAPGSPLMPVGPAHRCPTGTTLPIDLLVGPHELVATLDGHPFAHLVLSSPPDGVCLGLDGEAPGEISALTLRHPLP